MRSTLLFGVLTSLTLLVPSGPATGQYVGPGSAHAGTTVAAATALPNGALVVLEGYIIRRLDRERYVFRDPTGEIRVEIDNKKWMGRRVGPESKVRITGKMERNWWWPVDSNEIDVRQIEVLATK